MIGAGKLVLSVTVFSEVIGLGLVIGVTGIVVAGRKPRTGLELRRHGGGEDHGPHAGQLIDDGYELTTV